MSTYLYKIERTCLFPISPKEQRFISEFFTESEEDGIFCINEQELDAIKKEAEGIEKEAEALGQKTRWGKEIPMELMKKLRNEIRKDEHKELEFIFY